MAACTDNGPSLIVESFMVSIVRRDIQAIKSVIPPALDSKKHRSSDTKTLSLVGYDRVHIHTQYLSTHTASLSHYATQPDDQQLASPLPYTDTCCHDSCITSFKCLGSTIGTVTRETPNKRCHSIHYRSSHHRRRKQEHQRGNSGVALSPAFSHTRKPSTKLIIPPLSETAESHYWPTGTLVITTLNNHTAFTMCDYYCHVHSCKHSTFALGRLCASAALVQTPCKKHNIWNRINIPEPCDECGGGVMAEATPRTPQIPEKKKVRKEGREEKLKFTRKDSGFKGVRRS